MDTNIIGKYCFGTSLQVLRKTKKNLREINSSPSSDVNQGPSEYKALSATETNVMSVLIT